MAFNNFLIQFGNYKGGTNNFPIAFTKVVKMAAANEYSYNGNDNRITGITLTNFSAVANASGDKTYIAVGF